VTSPFPSYTPHVTAKPKTLSRQKGSDKEGISSTHRENKIIYTSGCKHKVTDRFGTGDSVTPEHVQVPEDAAVGIYSYRLSYSTKGRNFFTI
jgi:hypothetical protein